MEHRPDSLGARDEARHVPTSEPGWEESWSFDALLGERSALCVRLTLRPHDGVAWYWAHLVEAEGSVVSVRDHELSPPRPNGLLVRGDGLWADTICETPFEHWSLGLEAFAVRLSAVADAFTGERGERLPFGFDVEWEVGGDVAVVGGPGGYTQRGALHGEVLVGHDAVGVDAPAVRAHRWGSGSGAEAPPPDAEVVGEIGIPLDDAGARLVRQVWRAGERFGVADIVAPA